MRKYKEKFLWRRILYSNIVIIILLIIIFFISKGVFKLWKKYDLTKTDYEFVNSQKIEVENKLNLNQIKLDNINTEEGKEKYIRETYAVKKAGEEVIVIYKNPASTFEIPKGESNWEAFKIYIKNLFGF